VDGKRGNINRAEPSEWVTAGLEQAELIALGVDKYVPRLLAGLPDVGRPEILGDVPDRRPVGALHRDRCATLVHAS
jgi:hypothetical protein